MTPLELVLSKFPNAKRYGKRWKDRCPAHDDHNPSLSISEDEHGAAIVKCYANHGCTTDAICDAIGLRLPDLFPKESASSTFNGNRARPAKRSNIVAEKKPKPSGWTFPTAAEAIAELERNLGKRSAEWNYCDGAGKTVGVVVRWDRDEKKEFRPVSLDGEKWRIAGMPEPRPLYALPEIAAAETVYVCEGEKAADAIRLLGLTATTSAHGSESAEQTDWGPLAGKGVVILPDNDSPGGDYADEVASLVGRLRPRARIKIVELPGLPEKGDAVEWIAARDPSTEDEIRAELAQLVAEAEAIEVGEPEATQQGFVPFPVDQLPSPLDGIVKRAAKAIGCDPSFVVLPLLSALAAAIGNTRRLAIKARWEVPPILWTAIVAHSGAAKSPAIDVARKPVQDRQLQAFKSYEAKRQLYEVDKAEYDREVRSYQNGTRDDSPEKPREPVADRYWCDDVTTEAVAARLQKQPRGMLLIRDELAGWFGGFDRYSNGKGGDAARWLECYGGRPMLVDRKSGDPICIDRAAVCVTGGIQPDILKRSLSEIYRQNGLAARMLFAFPPRRPKRWSDAEFDDGDASTLAGLFDRLFGFEFTTTADGEPAPVVLKLASDARAQFIAFYNAHNEEQTDLGDDLSAAWSKLEECAARLALVVHCVRVAANDIELEDESIVDAASMETGITLTRWFANEALRIYAMLSETEGDAERRKLCEWIAIKGGRLTARMVQQGRRAGSAEEAEVKLQDLVSGGFGRWESSASGRRGQPTRYFVLSTATVSD